MTKTKKTILKITGVVNYTSEISEALAGRIIALCGMRDTPNAPNENEVDITISPSSRTETIPGSIGEYMDKFNPKRNPDKILVITAYLKERKGQQVFKVNDTKPYFYKAGEPVPGNFTRDFRWLLSSRWIAESDDQRGFFYITKKGLDVVHSCFPKELIAQSRGKANISRRREKKSS